LSFKTKEKRKRVKKKKETSQQTNVDEEGVEKESVEPEWRKRVCTSSWSSGLKRMCEAKDISRGQPGTTAVDLASAKVEGRGHIKQESNGRGPSV
jgi:hypothetical protein